MEDSGEARDTRTDGRHPIEVASRRTGLTKDVVRAWERRYEAVRPERTHTGRRLYSDADVERLRILRLATNGGRSIGGVAHLSTEELRNLVAQDESERLATAPSPAPAEPSQIARSYVDRCLRAIAEFDVQALRDELQRAVVSLSPVVLIEDVAADFMRRVGELWHKRELSFGQERLTTSAVRAVLDQVTVTMRSRSPHAPVLVSATPTGQVHEIGALLASAAAAAARWNVTYLGSDLPGAEIARSSLQMGVRVVAISLVYPPGDADMPTQLVDLRSGLADGVPILAGGAAAPSYAPVLERIDAVVVEGLPELRSILLDMDIRTNGKH
jgi:DNA-binding transcriptional MerR regulator/methylmalonyl-CoA mutase cobalamin-binding subunit